MSPILRCLPAVVLSLPLLAWGAPPPQAEREVDQLITALGQSGCQFQRNGTWYPAAEAQSHLRRKYDYLRKRDMVASAEQFIERAGTQSSMSGKAYQVRCPGKPVVTSAVWLNAKLGDIRHKP